MSPNFALHPSEMCPQVLFALHGPKCLERRLRSYILQNLALIDLKCAWKALLQHHASRDSKNRHNTCLNSFFHPLQVVLAKVKKGDGHELVMAFRGTETNWNQGLASDGLTDVQMFRQPVTKIRGLEKHPDLAKCWVSNRC